MLSPGKDIDGRYVVVKPGLEQDGDCDQPNWLSVNIEFTTAILSRFAMPNLPKPQSIRFREVSTTEPLLLKVAGFEPDPPGWVYPILDKR